MRLRGAICCGLVAVSAIACGLSVMGVDDAIDGSDASEEGGVRGDGGASPVDGSIVSDGDSSDATPPPPPLDPFDGGIDASPANCAAACGDAGTCVGGWCVITCDGSAACSTRVICPPGVPCDVRCTGSAACSSGVDCADATACKVVCDGAAACTNQKVTCSGAACRVECSQSSACSSGIECDAGVCALRCLGSETCRNGKVVCNAEACSVECGVTGKDGQNACTTGVECTAAKRCDVRCQAENACRNGSVVAVAGETADITCSGKNSCQAKVIASAGDSGVQCLGDGACKDGVSCDGGRCAAHCEKSDSHLCCDAGVCVPTNANCKMPLKCP